MMMPDSSFQSLYEGRSTRPAQILLITILLCAVNFTISNSIPLRSLHMKVVHRRSDRAPALARPKSARIFGTIGSASSAPPLAVLIGLIMQVATRAFEGHLVARYPRLGRAGGLCGYTRGRRPQCTLMPLTWRTGPRWAVARSERCRQNRHQ
jgi:hypothetical protein